MPLIFSREMLLKLSVIKLNTWRSADCHIIFIAYTILLLHAPKSDTYQILSSIYTVQKEYKGLLRR